MTKGKKRLLILLLVFMGIAGTFGYILYINQRYDYSHLISEVLKEEGMAFEPLKAKHNIKGMVLAAENERLALYINEETAEIAVRDTLTGEIWYSNPEKGQEDPLANGIEKAAMASQIAITYYDTVRREKNYNSYTDSVAKGQFLIEKIDQGVRVTYTLGEMSAGADLLPKYITPERFEEKILSKISEDAVKNIKKRYVESKAKPGFLELLESSKKSVIIVSKMVDALVEAGYTEEDLQVDNEASGHESVASQLYCSIPLEYRLEEDQLVATIQSSEIEESDNMQLSSIELLKYFGAADTEEEGYIVIPNGSGSLIYLNNGKTKEDAYMQPVYGMDDALYNRYRTQVTEKVRLPIWGMKKQGGSFLAYIEKGDTLATLNADIAGKVNSYNTAYSKFILRNSDWMSMTGVSGGSEELTIIEKNRYEGEITVRYCFLESKEAEYADMAKYYQQVLVKQVGLEPLTEKSQMPFYLELLGGIEKEQFFVGIPYVSVKPMTTAKEASEIADVLKDLGIYNLQMRYKGWFNGGVYHDVAKKIKLEKDVATKKELQNLSQKLSEQGGDFYPDVAIQLVPLRSKNYNKAKETTRFAAGQTVVCTGYNRATLRMNSNYIESVFNVNSPSALPDQINQFNKSYNPLKLENLSLRDLGDYIPSDKNKKHPIDREASKLIVTEQLGELTKDRSNILLTGGNAYALGFADHLVEAPVVSTDFYITDEAIPFYQMVIHGYIDYTGLPINLIEGYNPEIQLLEMLESGSAPYFLWTYEPSDSMLYTPFDDRYSTCYLDWIEDAKVLYTTFNEVMSPVRTSKIVNHSIHSKGVREVVYENGTSIYVNYTDKPYTVEGITINAKSYAVGGVNK